MGAQRMRNCPTSVLRSIPAVLALLPRWLAGFPVRVPSKHSPLPPSTVPMISEVWLARSRVAPVSSGGPPASLFLLRRCSERKLIRNSKTNRCIGPVPRPLDDRRSSASAAGERQGRPSFSSGRFTRAIGPKVLLACHRPPFAAGTLPLGNRTRSRRGLPWEALCAADLVIAESGN